MEVSASMCLVIRVAGTPLCRHVKMVATIIWLLGHCVLLGKYADDLCGDLTETCPSNLISDTISDFSLPLNL